MMFPNFKSKTQYDIIVEINKLIIDIDNNFDKLFNNLWSKIGDTSSNFSSISPLELTKSLLFGSLNYDSSSRKIDFNKNKTLLKTLIRSNGGFDNSIYFVKEIIKYLDDNISKVEKLIYDLNPNNIVNKSKLSDPENNIIDESTYFRLKDMYLSFLEEISSYRTRVFTLDTLYMNSKDAMNNPNINFNIKHDTLKRYYFSHVYDLKNNVMIFDKNLMLFGEIDNLMRNFDNIFDFLFGEFICIFQTFINQTSYIIENFKSSTK